MRGWEDEGLERGGAGGMGVEEMESNLDEERVLM